MRIDIGNNKYLQRLLHTGPDSSGERDIIQVLEEIHGNHLARLILKEWEILRDQEKIIKAEITHGESLGILMENELQKLSLENLNSWMMKASDDYNKDIRMAANVQRSFLMKTPPETRDYDIAFHFQPQSAVSGDFYDFYIDENNNLNGALVADVSGHGIASGLLTALAKPIFFRIFRSMSLDPLDSVLEKINKNLIHEMDACENYITAALLRFRGEKVEYVNAAHPNIIHLKQKTKSCSQIFIEEKLPHNTILGISAIQLPFKSAEFTMESGDTLLIYTDGLLESENEEGKQFGLGNTCRSLERLSECSAAEVLKNLLSDFTDYLGKSYIRDDITVIVIRRK